MEDHAGLIVMIIDYELACVEIVIVDVILHAKVGMRLLLRRLTCHRAASLRENWSGCIGGPVGSEELRLGSRVDAADLLGAIVVDSQCRLRVEDEVVEQHGLVELLTGGGLVEIDG